MTFAQRRNGLTSRFKERIPVVKRRITVKYQKRSALTQCVRQWKVRLCGHSQQNPQHIPSNTTQPGHASASDTTRYPTTKAKHASRLWIWSNTYTQTHTIHELKTGRSQSGMLGGRETNLQSHLKEKQTLQTSAGRKSVASSSQCPVSPCAFSLHWRS